MKAWKQVAQPHKDVLDGSLKQAEFAADISRVVLGTAGPEYQNAEEFFARTYITKMMRQLLIQVAQRLNGRGGDPVIQLQTNFGGGKTHTLLAVYHLAKNVGSTSNLAGIPDILDEAGISDLPAAKVAVIDGTNFSPAQPLERGKLKIKTLWGFLAYQLLGEAGFAEVAPSDESGTSPGKEVMVGLLRAAAPCVILCDELVAFFRQLSSEAVNTAGTFESNISFIQALTESVKQVPNAVLIASLPESDSELVGKGEIALKTLQKHFGRVESIWKTGDADEAFEIVRRRLFASPGERVAREEVCREFAEFYRKNKDKFPPKVQESVYYDRLLKSYPIHPEIFDRLYGDWSTLDGFQKTRGVLQYLALIIYRLWQDDNQDPFIMPGSIPLSDISVLNKSTQYLPVGWDPVISREIDGTQSIPHSLDTHNQRLGSVYAAHRVARSIFLGTAPHASEQASVRGMTKEEIMLGSALPDSAGLSDNVSLYEDALKNLRDKLHYLFCHSDRFWFDTHPNLRREMEDRKGKFDEAAVLKELEAQTRKVCGNKGSFAGFSIGTDHGDILDQLENGLRLVILPLKIEDSCNSTMKTGGINTAKKILRKHGNQPRIYQNRLVFLAPDSSAVGRAADLCRTYLAWKEIKEEIDSQSLNLDIFEVKQVENKINDSRDLLQKLIHDAYSHLLVPESPNARDIELRDLNAASERTLIASAAQTLKSEEELVEVWSPIHLKNLLRKHYFKTEADTEVSVSKVWQDMGKYCFMPRLMDLDVFRKTIHDGVQSGDFFGYAKGKEGDKYTGFSYAEAVPTIYIDENAVLIKNETAAAYKEALAAAACREENLSQGTTGEGPGEPFPSGVTPSAPGAHRPTGGTPSESDTPEDESKKSYRYFRGFIELDPVGALGEFKSIAEEIILNFTRRTGITVTVSVEIEAKSSDPFDDQLVRAVRENGGRLGIDPHFEK